MRTVILLTFLAFCTATAGCGPSCSPGMCPVIEASRTDPWPPTPPRNMTDVLSQHDRILPPQLDVIPRADERPPALPSQVEVGQ